jgi:hypothetical protein
VTRNWQGFEKEWWAGIIATLCLSFIMVVSATGCSWTDNQGTHHLIVGVGFGIITTTNRVGVEVRDSRILGGEFGPDTVGLGWMAHHRTAIDPAIASNVVISVKARGMNLTIKNFDPYGTNRNDSHLTNQGETINK